jgi:uncharacterized membrane protein YebE (DUF533 family)
MAEEGIHAKIKIECPGLPKMLAALSEFRGNMSQIIKRGMTSWAEPVRTEMLKRVPMDTGALAGSILAPKIKIEGSTVNLEFAAGGAAAGYAVYVHESLGKSKSGTAIRWKRPGSGPKFMENPINENIGKLDSEVAQEIEKATAGMKK